MAVLSTGAFTHCVTLSKVLTSQSPRALGFKMALEQGTQWDLQGEKEQEKEGDSHFLSITWSGNPGQKDHCSVKEAPAQNSLNNPSMGNSPARGSPLHLKAPPFSLIPHPQSWFLGQESFPGRDPRVRPSSPEALCNLYSRLQSVKWQILTADSREE